MDLQRDGGNPKAETAQERSAARVKSPESLSPIHKQTVKPLHATCDIAVKESTLHAHSNGRAQREQPSCKYFRAEKHKSAAKHSIVFPAYLCGTVSCCFFEGRAFGDTQLPPQPSQQR